MKKRAKQIAALLLAALFLLMPLTTALADTVKVSFTTTIIWHGGDPTTINLHYTAYDEFTLQDSQPATIGIDVATYIGNGEWQATCTFDFNFTHWSRHNLPFIGIDRSSVDGKWYVDKWNWNFGVYQPGQYSAAPYENSFLLTSSASTNNSITINRYFTSNSPSVDTVFDIYRYYDYASKYLLLKSVTIPAGQENTTVNGLYGGNYFVMQQTPKNYGYEITSGNSSTSSLGHGSQMTLSNSGGTNASVSFANTYYEPQMYAVDIPALTGGTVTPNVTRAAAGDTISLSVTPDADMQLVANSLKYNSSVISGTSFTMPASAVTVSAEFEARKYSVNVAALSGGKIIASPASAAFGETVNLTVTPNNGMELKPGTLKYSDGSDHAITGTSFMMPKSNVTVSTEFELPVSITTDGLPDGVIGAAYGNMLAVSGGTSPYVWSVSSGTLPKGLTLSADGRISGTPTETGEFPFSVSATDYNGKTASKTLTIIEQQVLSINLTSLSVEGGTLSPAFCRDIAVYAVTSDSGSFGDTITITAKMANSGSSMSIGGQNVTCDASGTGTRTVGLHNGANLIPVTMTSPDGLSQKSYIVSVNGTVSDANLNNLSVSGGNISFDKDTTSYSICIDRTISSIDITASTSDSKAIMLLNGAILSQGDTRSIDLSAGKNAISLMVVAQDATTRTYTITVNRQTKGSGNGAYLITPGSDAAYTGGLTNNGLPTMTVNSSVKGFTYFTVNIEAVTGHNGMETAVFVQSRNGQQINLSFSRADLDTAGVAVAGFNVKPGDIIEVYVVDDVANTGGSPVIL